MEKIEKITEIKKPETVEEAVECFQDDKKEIVIDFLRENKNEVGEFCLQVRDLYSKEDSTSPILRLSILIKDLL